VNQDAKQRWSHLRLRRALGMLAPLLLAASCIVNTKDYPVAGSRGSAGAGGAGAGGSGGQQLTEIGGGAQQVGEGGDAFAGTPGDVSNAGAAGQSANHPMSKACANPRDVSGGSSGNLGIPGSSHNDGPAACLRTTESFDTVTCEGVPPFTVNGVPAVCNAKASYPPPIDGYNYFDIPAGSVDGAVFRWSKSG